MNSSEKIELIRKGNQAFNNKDFAKAREYFIRTGYKDGLIRLGDYYMYERKLPLLAYGYYKSAQAKAKLADLHKRMVSAIAHWIGHDKLRPEFRDAFVSPRSHSQKTYHVDNDGMVPIRVNPDLKRKAQYILSGGDHKPQVG